MGIVAGGAVFNHPFACPPGDPFAVRTADPVFFLPEMTLAAQLVTVVHTHLGSFFGDQYIAIVLVVAGKTAKWLVLFPVGEVYGAVGSSNGICSSDLFVVVATAALKSLNLVFSGLGPKKTSLVFYYGQDGFWGNRRNQFNLPVVKGSSRILDGLYDAAFSRIGVPSGQDDNQQ